MREQECIFCKLANGEIQSNTLYEDEEFRVIFDLGPATRGHALIVPKKHFRNIYDMEDETLEKAAVLAKRMAKVMTKEFAADGFNIMQNNEEPAGQTVFHFHIHLIPRYKDDKAIQFWKPMKPDEAQLKAMAEQIQKCMVKE